MISKIPLKPARNVKSTSQAYNKSHYNAIHAPSRSIEDVSADLFYYAGKTYLVYVDRLSGWIKLSGFSHDPSSHQIISTIRKCFVETGVPVRIRTDGGPQFESSNFARNGE